MLMRTVHDQSFWIGSLGPNTHHLEAVRASRWLSGTHSPRRLGLAGTRLRAQVGQGFADHTYDLAWLLRDPLVGTVGPEQSGVCWAGQPRGTRHFHLATCSWGMLAVRPRKYLCWCRLCFGECLLPSEVCFVPCRSPSKCIRGAV